MSHDFIARRGNLHNPFIPPCLLQLQSCYSHPSKDQSSDPTLQSSRRVCRILVSRSLAGQLPCLCYAHCAWWLGEDTCHKTMAKSHGASADLCGLQYCRSQGPTSHLLQSFVLPGCSPPAGTGEAQSVLAA